ncbi:YaaA family protein [Bailinhaonella thermotolerans]|uniref:Peroxide stress protein YaaA n=1 Tax=Bailinhaonella thermotolerans TaxID=1070861 RepID=A0A3A4BSX7_9ACTN|nr:peroxide stress protein YaaA [Bailinhaonella thermotolerans]RJL34416.1 peroxide stress protein YaaA [Bailinhaonella thermotolerans]
MLVLLPPSEGKADAGDGPPLDPSALSFPALAGPRERVLDALTRVCSGPDAAAVLGLSPGLAGEAAKNLAIREAPTLTAAELYTGVLYDNLGLATLGAAADSVIIFSGLWGALRVTDRVPPYRLSMSVRLPPLGGLAAFWRPALTAALPSDRLIVDMRSAPYAAAWRAPGAVAVRVLRETIVNGAPRRTVVSHMAKATRGAVARALLLSGAGPETPEDLAKLLHDLGHTAELDGRRLDIVIPG